jgi:hypothetical protein
MRARLLAIMLMLLPAAAFAQAYNGSVNTSPRGGAGGSIDTRVHTGIDTSTSSRAFSDDAKPPIDVQRFVGGRRDVGTTGGSVSVGQSVPSDTQIQSVPGYPQWGYGTVNGQRIIINRNNNTVGGVVDR